MDMGGVPAVDYGYPLPIPVYSANNPITALSATAGARFLATAPRRFNFWMNTICWTFQITGTNNSANYWQLSLQKYDGSNQSVIMTDTTINEGSAGNWYSKETLINQALGNNQVFILVDMNRIGTPGNIIVLPPVIYGRPIG